MDFATISGAYQGLIATKEILSGLFDAKVSSEANQKIYEALHRLGESLDTLYGLREELFKLQDENNRLRQEITYAKNWDAKAAQYELTKTEGGAVAYKFKGEPEHFICPSCFNSQQIHILQMTRSRSGMHHCTGCKSEFPIEPEKPRRALSVQRMAPDW